MGKEREILKDEANVPEIGRTRRDVLALQENASALERLETRDRQKAWSGLPISKQELRPRPLARFERPDAPTRERTVACPLARASRCMKSMKAKMSNVCNRFRSPPRTFQSC